MHSSFLEVFLFFSYRYYNVLSGCKWTFTYLAPFYSLSIQCTFFYKSHSPDRHINTALLSKHKLFLTFSHTRTRVDALEATWGSVSWPRMLSRWTGGVGDRSHNLLIGRHSNTSQMFYYWHPVVLRCLKYCKMCHHNMIRQLFCCTVNLNVVFIYNCGFYKI